MGPQLTIATASVVLRTLTLDDAEKVFCMSQEADLRKWIPTQVYRDVAETKEVLAYLISHYGDGADPRTCPIVLGIQHTSSGDLIGHVGLSPFREYVEIGFAIEDAQKKKGYATAAVREMCHWSETEFSLEKIHGFVAKDNEASKRVLLRSGFSLAGEETMLFQGFVQPVVIYRLNHS